MPIRLLRKLLGRPRFSPRPPESVGFIERGETKSDGGITVTAAVLGPAESRAAFDAWLAVRGIQPVWLKIENREDTEYYFLPINLDPDYLSPFEAARRCHSLISFGLNKRIDAYFRNASIPLEVLPRSTVSGFVFANLDEGSKPINVELFSQEALRRVFFNLEVPGMEADHARVDFDRIYDESQLIECDEKTLQEELKKLPSCALGGDRKTPGDPLNLVLIGPTEEIGAALQRRGWDETETTYLKSAVRTVRSLVFRSRYRYSPVSSLYVFGRRQDAAFQKARTTVTLRNHLRLWQTPLRFKGDPVYIGQISRDIGLRLTWKTVITHKIDPEVDEARDYLSQDLAMSQGVAKFTHVKGVDAASPSRPRRNYTGDPYYTDGLRAVFFCAAEQTSLQELEILDWEIPPPRN